MSEMLGNQYFMARNYKDAIKELEPIYLKDASNKPVRRKLIICYTQLGRLAKALELFISLVKDDVNFIIKADPIYDDCPCSEIVKNSPSPKETVSSDINIYNGILWLFCDPSKSLKYLKKIALNYPDNLDEIINIIKSVVKKEKLKVRNITLNH